MHKYVFHMTFPVNDAPFTDFQCLLAISFIFIDASALSVETFIHQLRDYRQKNVLFPVLASSLKGAVRRSLSVVGYCRNKLRGRGPF